MKRAPSIALPGLAIVLTVALAGCQTLMPTAAQPYLLMEPATSPAQSAWQWTEARPPADFEVRETAAGVQFGDRVMLPRPAQAVQALFAQSVAAHEDAAQLRQHLAGKTLRLTALEAHAGLRTRLSERQVGQWEVMRVRLVVEVGPRSYEALDVHSFSNSERPSPLSIPLRNAVDNLVRQIHLFP
ncbi:MAG TPA: hypothetical protein VLJ58_18860 [Ramlibacter sp.]|nr:hypothetical protein [Ramlibacter sp.]